MNLWIRMLLVWRGATRAHLVRKGGERTHVMPLSGETCGALLLGLLVAASACSKGGGEGGGEAGTKPGAAQGSSATLTEATLLAHDISQTKTGLALAVTEDGVFFTSDTGVNRLPPRGGASVQVSPFRALVHAMVVDKMGVVLGESAEGGGTRLAAVSLAPGSRPVPLCEGVAADIVPYQDRYFAIDAENVYWRHGESDERKHAKTELPFVTTVYRCPRSGGAAVVVAKNVRAGSGTGPVALAGRRLLCGDIFGLLYSVSLDDGSATLLASAADNNMTSVASDGEYAYFTEAGTKKSNPRWPGERDKDGAVRRIRLSGGDVEAIALGQEWPGSLVVDDKYVFWTTGLGAGERNVKRAKRSGGDVSVVASGDAAAIAVSTENVYWLVKGTKENAFRDAKLFGRSK